MPNCMHKDFSELGDIFSQVSNFSQILSMSFSDAIGGVI